MRLLLAFIFLLITTPCRGASNILVSIAPLHSLVSQLTRGISEPQLLLPQGGSPHSASLRPSQARALAQADLFIWVGPELESFLTQPVARLVNPQAEMQLLKMKDLKLFSQRHGGFWEEDLHEGETKHEPQSINPHIWLSPYNARQIVSSVCARLIQIDPTHKSEYQQNLVDLLQRIDRLQQELQQRLTPVKDRPYLVFHDAYPYFEKAFSLNAIGSIRISAERAPGARRLQQIRNKVINSEAICLFTEPQFSPALAETLAAGSGLKLGVLDPLGSRSSDGDDGWFKLMDNLADNLINCLGEEARSQGD